MIYITELKREVAYLVCDGATSCEHVHRGELIAGVVSRQQSEPPQAVCACCLGNAKDELEQELVKQAEHRRQYDLRRAQEREAEGPGYW